APWVAGELASPNRGDYCVSKAGLPMAVKLFASRLAADGIPVYEVRPGIIATDMTDGVKAIYDRRIADGLVPENRWGQPDDVGKVVAALLRGDVPYATGTVTARHRSRHRRRAVRRGGLRGPPTGRRGRGARSLDRARGRPRARHSL